MDINNPYYHYYYGTYDGGYAFYEDTMSGKSYCSKMSQIDSTDYSAICDNEVSDHTWADNPCPKGWGKNKKRYPNDYYSVIYAQGHAKNGVPIYSTVTKYRDAVYNYITTRVAKA